MTSYRDSGALLQLKTPGGTNQIVHNTWTWLRFAVRRRRRITVPVTYFSYIQHAYKAPYRIVYIVFSSRFPRYSKHSGLTLCFGPICPGCGSGRPEPFSQSSLFRTSVLTVRLTLVYGGTELAAAGLRKTHPGTTHTNSAHTVPNRSGQWTWTVRVVNTRALPSLHVRSILCCVEIAKGGTVVAPCSCCRLPCGYCKVTADRNALAHYTPRRAVAAKKRAAVHLPLPLQRQPSNHPTTPQSDAKPCVTGRLDRVATFYDASANPRNLGNATFSITKRRLRFYLKRQGFSHLLLILMIITY